MAKTWEQIAKELKNPFHPEDIDWRVGSTTQDKAKGLALAYITNRAIQNRLDEVFGINNWRNEFRDWKGNGVLCGISIRLEGDSEWITKWDGADESNMEATKGGLSDSMKRAGYQLGIGRYLYNLESQWVEIKQAGKSYVIQKGKEPFLPQWALPEGYTYKKGPLRADPPHLVDPKSPIIDKDKPVSSKSKPDFTSFWAECKKLGYTQAQVFKLAKVDSLKDWDRSMLDELYRDIKAINNEQKRAEEFKLNNSI